MQTFEELKKQQDKLSKEPVKCPKCGTICSWGEMIEESECGHCWCEATPSTQTIVEWLKEITEPEDPRKAIKNLMRELG